MKICSTCQQTYSDDVEFCPRDGAHLTAPPGSEREANVNSKDGLNYAWIPPGSFQMGCSPGENQAAILTAEDVIIKQAIDAAEKARGPKDAELYDVWCRWTNPVQCRDDGKPLHPVTITKGFWLGQTEVTVGAYKRFAEATGQQMPPEPDCEETAFNPGWGNEAMPIVNVTWRDAQAYCRWAEGRLPTEAEWEYAARAGSTAARCGPLGEIAWYADNSGRQRLHSNKLWKENPAYYLDYLCGNGNGMHEVGLKRANGFGLYDMLGNVWEWVNDWYDENYYQNSPSQDPGGPASGTHRVMRGGSWSDCPKLVGFSYRVRGDPDNRCSNAGFRCVREVFGL
jgi:formylglycine-generating enzyme required for sulfatase activity